MEEKIRSVCYREAGFSDNDYLTVELDPGDLERGTVAWVLTANILQDLGYCEKMRDIILWSMERGMDVEGRRIWWDNLKYDIKELSIERSRHLQKFKKQAERRVRKGSQTELDRINKEGGGSGLARMMVLEDELKRLEEEKCRGSIVRSKVQYAVEGERCMKFFL